MASNMKHYMIGVTGNFMTKWDVIRPFFLVHSWLVKFESPAQFQENSPCPLKKILKELRNENNFK